MHDILNGFTQLWYSTGIYGFLTEEKGWGMAVMILVGFLLLYLAIKKGFEPLLLVPIGMGCILSNIPLAYIAGVDPNSSFAATGFIKILYDAGIESGLFPVLIFMGVGAMTDFGPLIANPKTLLLGAAAQFGIFMALIGAVLLAYIPGINFTLNVASSIGIIGGADGPTAIYVTSRLAPSYLGSIAVAAYSYMALVPIIQPPIIRLLTTKKERAIKMEQLRPVSKREKIMFPIIVTIITVLIVPACAPLIGMLMFGNLIKESGVVPNLVHTAANSLLYIVTILLGVSVGATATGSNFLTLQTIQIFALGICAFALSTAGGVLGGKVMCLLTHGKVNPMIGAAGVSAVPMAARVVQKEGQRVDPENFLLMHAMGPNVAGVIGSAIAAGILLTLAGIL